MNALAHQFSFLDETNLSSFRDVDMALRRLDKLLRTSSLKNVAYFNETYRIITTNVRAGMRRGAFQQPSFIRRFDIRFATYYFKALSLFLSGKQPSPAWRYAFEQSLKADCSPLQAMALGVNAHVNNDIPQVLLECRADLGNKDDYDRVNDIIQNSIERVIHSLDAGQAPLDPRNPLLTPVFPPVMNLLLREWRLQAWWRFMQLKRGVMRVKAVERSSLNCAKALTSLPM